MEELRYKCNDKGPFFAGSSVEVDCRLYMEGKRMGPFVAHIDSEPEPDNPFNFSIEIKPEDNLEENLEKVGIDEDDFESAMLDEFNDIPGFIGTALKNKEGVLEV